MHKAGMKMWIGIGVVMLFQLFGSAQQPPEIAQAMLREINKMRAAGCQCGSEKMQPVAPLEWNDLLTQAARRHAEDMLQNDFFSHTGSDGSSSSQRIKESGYDFMAAGENVAEAPQEHVLKLWIESPSHCKNLMQPRFTQMGLAWAGNYWVLDFGAPMPKR